MKFSIKFVFTILPSFDLNDDVAWLEMKAPNLAIGSILQPENSIEHFIDFL